jgi:hypothetical protein
VQKLSKKGWVCKTWEGEIAMVTMPGPYPKSSASPCRMMLLAEKINAMAGQRVVLHYQQHKYIPFSCFGETEYFVDGARSLREESAPLPPPSVTQGQLLQPR